MHVFVSKFTEIHTRPDPNGNPYPYYADDKGKPIPVCIVDYATAKRIEHPRYYDSNGERLSSEEISKINTLERDNRQCSIYFTTQNTKYGLVGVVFNDTQVLRQMLKNYGSEELKS